MSCIVEDLALGPTDQRDGRTRMGVALEVTYLILYTLYFIRGPGGDVPYTLYVALEVTYFILYKWLWR